MLFHNTNQNVSFVTGLKGLMEGAAAESLPTAGIQPSVAIDSPRSPIACGASVAFDAKDATQHLCGLVADDLEDEDDEDEDEEDMDLLEVALVRAGFSVVEVDYTDDDEWCVVFASEGEAITFLNIVAEDRPGERSFYTDFEVGLRAVDKARTGRSGATRKSPRFAFQYEVRFPEKYLEDVCLFFERS